MDTAQILPYVGAAYGGIWVVLIGYLILLGRRQARLEKEAALLGSHLTKKESPGRIEE